MEKKSTLMENLFQGERLTIPAGTYTDTVRGNMKIYLVIHNPVDALDVQISAFTNADDAIKAANFLVCDHGTVGEIEEHVVKGSLLYSATNSNGDHVRVEEVELK